MSIETSNRLPGAEARRLTSVLALDVCGYSALSERDEGLAIQVVTQVRRLVDAKALKFGGRRFHKAADGFLVEFQSPISALSAALEMQEAIASDLPTIPDFTVLARVGLHVGEVQEQEDGDLLGHGVNIAARLQQEADPGGILVSSNLLNLVGDKFTGRRRRRGHMALKNISEPIEAFDIEATQTTVSRAMKRIQKAFRRNALVFSLFAIGVVVAIAIPVLMEGAKSGDAQLDGRVEAIIEESFSDENGRAVRSLDSAYIRGVLRRLGESGQPTDQASFAMLEAGNIEGGIEVLSEHLSELSPSSDAYVPVLHQIGALAFSNNSDKAIATYESILLKDPDDVIAQVYLARSIGHHGKQKQAARLYEKALASDKLDQVGRLNVRMNLAFLKILDGEYERAVEMLLDLEPEVNALGRPDVTETLYTEKGIALERVDRLDEAEADLLAARVKRQATDFGLFDAEALSILYFNDAIYTNMVMAGFAWQKGGVPVSLRGVYRAIKLNGVKAADNMAAFDLGRIAAHDPERLESAKDPRGEVKEKTLDEIIADRTARLTEYQNAAYAQTYVDAVAKVRAAEAAAGLGERLTLAVAKYAYKVMAYKDEYEVARLWTDGKFDAYLAKTFKGGKVNYHLAPPLFSKTDENGHLVKKKFGPWMKLSFKMMKRFKGLRGTRFDVFGKTAERKMERGLRDQYLENLDVLLADLSGKNHDLAVAIAEVPNDIRGYGHVKEASVEKAAVKEAELWANWPVGKLPAAKTTLIGRV